MERVYGSGDEEIMEQQYLDLLSHVLDCGHDVEDRTGTGTRTMFGAQLRFDLAKGFPAVTTKKLAFNSMKAELLWFIKGSTNVNELRAIQYGEENRDNKEKVTVWDANYENQAKNLGYVGGELGPVYGKQWRGWQSNYTHNEPYDQLQEAIETIKTNPDSRRIIISAWNVDKLDRMALPPCHCFFQFRVINGCLSCQVFIRSNDLFLGAPFNIASYALLTHMVAQVCKLDVGELVYTVGDAHIYNNHFKQVEEQLERKPFEAPKLVLNKDITDINDFTMDDIQLEGYQCHPPIKADMAV